MLFLFFLLASTSALPLSYYYSTLPTWFTNTWGRRLPAGITRYNCPNYPFCTNALNTLGYDTTLLISKPKLFTSYMTFYTDPLEHRVNFEVERPYVEYLDPLLGYHDSVKSFVPYKTYETPILRRDYDTKFINTVPIKTVEVPFVTRTFETTKPIFEKTLITEPHIPVLEKKEKVIEKDLELDSKIASDDLEKSVDLEIESVPVEKIEKPVEVDLTKAVDLEKDVELEKIEEPIEVDLTKAVDLDLEKVEPLDLTKDINLEIEKLLVDDFEPVDIIKTKSVDIEPSSVEEVEPIDLTKSKTLDLDIEKDVEVVH